MRALVTGGTGFVGNYLARELSEQGDEVSILCKTASENAIILDITNKEDVLEKVKGFDIVYHVAGNIRTPETDKKELHLKINSEGTLNILEACKQNNITRVIFVSTVEVYGTKLKGEIKEDSELNPENDYAESKVLAESHCKEYSKQGMKITVVRLAYVYGPGQFEQRIFPRLVASAIGRNKEELAPKGGNNFIYIKDAVKGIALLGKNYQKENFEVYNISSGKYNEMKEVFEAVKELTGYEYEEVEENNEKFVFSIEKARKIGYGPEFGIKKGMKDYIEEENE